MGFDKPVRLLTSRLGRLAFQPLMRDRACIFLLHRVEDRARGIHGHSIEFVRKALSALADSGAKFVSLRSMIECWRKDEPVEPNCVAFTIDDGFADQVTLVREAFLPISCPVTVFLVSGFLDGRLWPWDDQLAHAFRNAKTPAIIDLNGAAISVRLDCAQSRAEALHRVRDECKKLPNADIYSVVESIAKKLGSTIPSHPPDAYRPMTWDEARSLEHQGVEFGPHSVSHRIFSSLSQRESRAEIEASQQRLRQELANPLPIFAWPTGRDDDFAAKDVAIAREAGLHACMATNSDYAHMPPTAHPDALYKVRRFAFPHDVATVLRYGSWLERGRQLLPI